MFHLSKSNGRVGEPDRWELDMDHSRSHHDRREVGREWVVHTHGEEFKRSKSIEGHQMWVLSQMSTKQLYMNFE